MQPCFCCPVQRYWWINPVTIRPTRPVVARSGEGRAGGGLLPLKVSRKAVRWLLLPAELGRTGGSWESRRLIGVSGRLEGVKRGIAGVGGEQPLVGAVLGQPAALHDQDQVRSGDRGEAVRDHQGDAAGVLGDLASPPHVALEDRVLARRVERGRGLV